jgi:hypothetical protein
MRAQVPGIAEARARSGKYPVAEHLVAATACRCSRGSSGIELLPFQHNIVFSFAFLISESEKLCGHPNTRKLANYNALRPS